MTDYLGTIWCNGDNGSWVPLENAEKMLAEIERLKQLLERDEYEIASPHLEEIERLKGVIDSCACLECGRHVPFCDCVDLARAECKRLRAENESLVEAAISARRAMAVKYNPAECVLLDAAIQKAKTPRA